MYSRIVSDEDKFAPAEVEVTGGAHIVYVQARYPAQAGRLVTLAYDRKQALILALALVIAVVRSFRRFH